MQLKGNRTYAAIATFAVGAIVKRFGIPGVDSAATAEIVDMAATGLEALGTLAALHFRAKAQPVDKQGEQPIAKPAP